MKCPECGRKSDYLEPSDIRSIISESSSLLKYYEEGELVDVYKGMCWSCLWNEILDFFAYLGFDEQRAIRKEYNKTWAPEFRGCLHRILNAAMENVCLNCGVHVPQASSYDKHNEGGKKIVKGLLRRAGLRLKDVDRQIYVCQDCVDQLTEENRDKQRKANPMLRCEAEKAVQEFLEGIKRVNQDDRFDSYINACVVFGSFLSDKERISDIDITVFNKWKPTHVRSKNTLSEIARFKEELNWLITEANNTPGLTPFQFHVWSTLAAFKAEQGDTFHYEYLYAESPEAKADIEKGIERMVQEFKKKDSRRIILV